MHEMPGTPPGAQVPPWVPETRPGRTPRWVKLAVGVGAIGNVLALAHHHNRDLSALGGPHGLGKPALVLTRNFTAAHRGDFGLG